MAIRISGLNSGLDTESIVSALVSSYSAKKDKYVKAQTKLSWTQDAWKSINTKVYSMYSKLDSMRYTSGYSLKKTTVSDPTKATVTASGSAFNGSQKLNVLSTAQSGYLTGAKLDSSTSGSTTMAELGYTGSDGKIEISRGDGSKAEITVAQNMTVNDFISQLKDNGLNANFDATNKRIYVNSKSTGADADFNLTGSNINGVRALNALGLNVDTQSTRAITSAYSSLYDADETTMKSKIADMVSAYKTAQSDYDTASAQNANLTSAYGYSVAYSATQDTLKTLSSYAGVDTDKLTDYLTMSSSVRSNSIETDDGSVYTKTATDDDGNAIYSKDNGDGTSSYIKAVTTYSDGVGEFTMNADGKLTDAAGMVEFAATGATDDDGNAIYKATNGSDVEITVKATTKYYASDATTTTEADPESGEETTKTTYSTGAEVGADTVPNKLDAIGEAIKTARGDEDMTDTNDMLSTLAGNLSKVNSFENASDTTISADDAYSHASIAAAVHAAYESSGASGVEDYTNTFGTVIADNRTTMNKASDVLSENSVVSELAGYEEGTEEYDNALNDLLDKIRSAYEITSSGLGASEGASKIDGKDAKILLNGAEYTSNNGSFNINGLSINALAETGEGDENAINITTSNDTQGIYDKIKDFLEEYNEVINEITKLYNADSARGYEPLTDEEKEAMTDSQVEKWESKIKSSLLRRDTTLGGIMTAMTSSMSSVFEINGKNYSLGTFGISTLGILNSAKNEHNAYHIDGDADDSSTSTKTDKLMAALNEDPDSVVEFMKKLTNNLHENLYNKMKSTSLRSAYTIYNDKEMASEYSDYTTTIKKWEQKVADMEDSYYKKFSAMEKALATLNSNSSQLTGMLG